MSAVETLTRDLLTTTGQLARLVEPPTSGGAAGAVPEIHGAVERTAGALRGLADEGLASADDVQAIRRGVAAARAAIALEPGSRALRDVAGADGRARALLLALAYRQCLTALHLLTEAD